MPTLEKRLEDRRRKIIKYQMKWPAKSGKHALKWVDHNFDLQGYRDKNFIRWKKLKHNPEGRAILQATGKYRRSIKLAVNKNSYRIYSRAKQARALNDGFRGTVTVRAHNRRKRIEGKIGNYNVGASFSVRSHRQLADKKVHDVTRVKQHRRRMSIPRRQVMPSVKRGSTMLTNELKEMQRKDMLNILRGV